MMADLYFYVFFYIKNFRRLHAIINEEVFYLIAVFSMQI